MAKTRERWTRRVEFVLVAVGFSVGVGDLWRFPYLVMKNGGGIGYGAIISTFILSIYFGVLICWMVFYFINSFYPTLPWASCENDWNTNYCEVYYPNSVNISTATNQYGNLTRYVNATLDTNEMTHGGIKTSPAEDFWNHQALKISSGLEDLGDVNWPLFGCLSVVELLCFLCIFKGIKVTGKIIYFTVVMPFVLLTVFLIRSIILPGAKEGVLFYLTPDLEKLKDPKIWAEACMQVFMSVGVGCGAMITFASYNKFNNNCLRDAIITCLSDLMTGIYAGFVIFSMLGHLSKRTGIPIHEFKISETSNCLGKGSN